MPARQFLNIAIIDADFSTRKLLDWTIRQSWGHRASTYPSTDAYLAQPAADADVVLLGIAPAERNPASELQSVLKRNPSVSVILVCNREDNESAAALLHAGAWDYFTRPVDLLRMQGILLHLRSVRDIERNLSRKKNSHPKPQNIGQSAVTPDSVPSMDHAKERAIRRALKASGGNVKEAARLLGIGRTTIYKLMHKFSINPRHDSSGPL